MVEALKANVEVEKTRILTFIGKSGPIVSPTVAKSLNLNSFLTSALLSELFNEKKLNASTIRVGGSALYYLDGQAEQLERFTNFLGHKEREAYTLLKKEGVSVSLLDMPTIKPIDTAAIIKAAKSTGAIVTVEDHQIIGGLGSAVCEVLAENYPISLKRIGIRDTFTESGEFELLLDKYGLSAAHIAEAAKHVIKMKK